ncbi:hypothetical protein ACLVWU_13055 [Bdellovibrio sp. HCB290]|uniref:hypothetical protein n=1 Tax=Bdellovibrio sp. HCB290 TaxID=3394356 RepID=UPI0039B68E1D
MKSVFSLLLIAFASTIVHAQPQFGAVLVNSQAMGSCRIDYPFNPPGFGDTELVIFWNNPCLNGRANGVGYVADSNSGKGYFAEFRDGKLYNNVFAELSENGIPKIKGYVAGDPFSSADEYYCSKYADRCNRLLSYLKGDPGLAIGENTVDGCGIDIIVNTSPYFNDVKWTGKCVNGRAQGSGWLTYKNVHNSTVDTYTDYSQGKQSNPYYYRRTRTIHGRVSEYLGKRTLGANTKIFVDVVTSCNGDKNCQRISKIGKQGPGQASGNSSAQSGSSSVSGNSSASDGSLGSVTPPPADFLRSIQGDRVSCTDAALGAVGKRMMDKYGAELRSNSMCTTARASAKAHYEVIVTIEKSCPPEMIPQVADMQPLRSSLQSALDTIQFSCPY